MLQLAAQTYHSCSRAAVAVVTATECKCAIDPALLFALQSQPAKHEMIGVQSARTEYVGFTAKCRDDSLPT